MILRNEAARNCKQTKIYSPSLPWHGPRVFCGQEHQRLRRSLSTVILEEQQKVMLVDDVRNFLTRSGVLRYQEKGLPLRLGYLFSGPPGTGKSSLAFALASNFGLPVYMINLSSPGLHDGAIDSLFSSLPRHCVVLLEDVDATQPLSRDLPTGKKSDDDGNAVDEASLGGEDDMLPPPPGQGGPMGSMVLGPMGAMGPGVNRRRNSVTLSGLLNAIDGVGASEGQFHVPLL